MEDDTKASIAVIAFTLILIALIAAASAWVNSTRCHSQWRDSGMKTDWAIIQGCRVQLPDGRWIPSDRVREIDIKVRPLT